MRSATRPRRASRISMPTSRIPRNCRKASRSTARCRGSSPTGRWCRASSSASAVSTPCAAIWNPKCSATTARSPISSSARPTSGNLLQAELKDETGQGKPRFITFNDWRFFTFVDGGYAAIHDPLIDQQATFRACCRSSWSSPQSSSRSSSGPLGCLAKPHRPLRETEREHAIGRWPTPRCRPDLLPPKFAAWFEGRGWSPRAHQLEMIAKARGRDALLIAPTGGGKTLAGFLPSLIQPAPSGRRPTPRAASTPSTSPPLKALAVRRRAQPDGADPPRWACPSSPRCRTGDTGAGAARPPAGQAA